MSPAMTELFGIIALVADAVTILSFVLYTQAQKIKRAYADGERAKELQDVKVSTDKLFERVRQLEDNHHENDKAIGVLGEKMDGMLDAMKELKGLFQKHLDNTVKQE